MVVKFSELTMQDKETLKFIEDWMGEAIQRQRFGKDATGVEKKFSFKQQFLRTQLNTISSETLSAFFKHKYRQYLTVGALVLGVFAFFGNFKSGKTEA